MKKQWKRFMAITLASAMLVSSAYMPVSAEESIGDSANSTEVMESVAEEVIVETESIELETLETSEVEVTETIIGTEESQVESESQVAASEEIIIKELETESENSETEENKAEILKETEGINTNDYMVNEDEVTAKLDALIAEYDGTYWTMDGQPSDSEGTTSKKHGDIQSKGFANFIFNELFGVWNIGEVSLDGDAILSPDGAEELGHLPSIELKDVEALKNLFTQGKPGDYIQEKYRDTEKNHSAILIKVLDNGVELLECDVNEQCDVQRYIISWNEFAKENLGVSLYRASNYEIVEQESEEIVEEVEETEVLNEAASGNIVASGACGENLTWTLDDQGTLTISGQGKMDDYGPEWNDRPEWYGQQYNKLIIEDGVTSIGNYAFYGFDAFNGNLRIPDSVMSIGTAAFMNCSGFTGNLVIPENVTFIGSSAFCGCSGFTGDLRIPDGMTSIKSGVFLGCSGFTGDLRIPDGVITIEFEAFLGCSGLTGNLIIPDSVTSIGNWAFKGCSGLTGNLTIPDSVTCIERFAFARCSGFTGDLSIPEGIASIEDSVFEECNGFTSLTMPDSVTSIGESAFYGCSGFTGELRIPNSVTSIGNWAFAGCSGFTGSLIIPNEVISIGRNAFRGCSGFVGKLKIPDSVAEIMEYAFSGTKVNQIYFLGDIPQIAGDVFTDVEATVYYPSGNSTWTSGVMQNYGGTLTWQRWNPNENKIVVSIPGESTDRYLSGSVLYETDIGESICTGGDREIKNTKWDIQGNVEIRDGTLYIRSHASVMVHGRLYVENIVIESGGNLTVCTGGRVYAKSVTAKGGWIWGLLGKGGEVGIEGGKLITDNLNFEGQSSAIINSSGIVVVENTLSMKTGNADCRFKDGHLFIGGRLVLKGNRRSFITNDANFYTVFYGNGESQLETNGDEFCLGIICVTDESNFKRLPVSSKNYIAAISGRVDSSNWTFEESKKISDISAEADYNTQVENAFSGIAAKSAFKSNNSALTAEENQFVDALAAVWINTLNTPLCKGFIESSSVESELEFSINRKTCTLTCTGPIYSFGGFAGVYLNVNNADHVSLVGTVANARVDKFSEKAKEYLSESMKSEFISYASGGVAGALSKYFNWGTVTKDVVEKFLETITKKVCVDESVLKTNDPQSLKNLKQSFKINKLLISNSSKEMSAEQDYNSFYAGMDNNFIDAEESLSLSTVSDIVIDEWLKKELIRVLGSDSSGEPDFSKAEEITELDVSNSYIRDLSGIQYLTNLKKLDVSNNELTDLSPIAGLTRLQTLNVSGQYISNLSPLRSLTELTSLDVSDNCITTLSSISGFGKLQILNAGENDLTTLSSLSELSELVELTISGNPLKDGSLYALSNLGKLKIVRLEECGLTSIDGINTDSLEEIYLAENQITSLATIGDAVGLWLIDASDNNIVTLDDITGSAGLRTLILKGNFLQELTGLEQWPNIEILDLSQTGITEENLNVLLNLVNLKELDISDNCIFGLNALTGIASLKKIDITNTVLSEDEIMQLEQNGSTIVNNTILPTIKKLYFMNNSVNLKCGQRSWMNVLCYPSAAGLAGVQWKSSDESVLTVDNVGIITAKNAGEATVTARIGDEEASCKVQVMALEVEKYPITYDANGGQAAPESQEKMQGQALKLTEDLPEKSYVITYDTNGGSIGNSNKTIGCTFKNWNTKADGSGTGYNSGDEYTLDESATLYAQWTEPTAETLETPTRPGYTFNGWYTEKSGGNKVTSSATVTGDMILYAHWTKEVPKDPVEAFVSRLYKEILGREADPSGLKAWSNVLKSGKEQGAKVAQGFVDSEELKKRNLSDDAYIRALYRTFFDREADGGGLKAWKKVLDSGLSRMHVFRGFAESDEFTKVCDSYGIIRGYADLTAPMDQNEGVTKFIVRSYRLCLNREADAGGLNGWCDAILSGRNTAKEAAHGFVFSEEFLKKNLSDREYIKILYRVFMDREADAGGLEAWEKVLKEGKSREHVFNGFADSPEFRKICQSYGIK